MNEFVHPVISHERTVGMLEEGSNDSGEGGKDHDRHAGLVW